MATRKKQYTNNDIFKKLDDVDGRLKVVEDWKQGILIGQAAVDEYKKREAADSKNTILTAIKDLMPYIALIVAGAAAILYAYASRAK